MGVTAKYNADGDKWSEELIVYEVKMWDLDSNKKDKALFLAETIEQAISFAKVYFMFGREEGSVVIIGCKERGNVIFPVSE